MITYLARVLTEHHYQPKILAWSAFEEVLVAGRLDLEPYWDLVELFEENQTFRQALFQDISDFLNTSYQNANNNLVTVTVREIVSLANLPDSISLGEKLVELDTKLYTFGETLDFADFKKKYDFGQFGE